MKETTKRKWQTFQLIRKQQIVIMIGLNLVDLPYNAMIISCLLNKNGYKWTMDKFDLFNINYTNPVYLFILL